MERAVSVDKLDKRAVDKTVEALRLDCGEVTGAAGPTRGPSSFLPSALVALNLSASTYSPTYLLTYLSLTYTYYTDSNRTRSQKKETSF